MNRLFAAFLAAIVFTSAVSVWAQSQPPLPILDDDFRVSHMGTDGFPAFDAAWPTVAYNQHTGNWLVVFQGSTDVSGEHEIWGQRYNYRGQALGERFRISTTGTDGDAARDAYWAKVVYNSVDHEFFVVWVSDNDAVGDYEVWGQRIGSDGSLTGSAIRISAMGDALVDPGAPATRKVITVNIAYDSFRNRYLVVWDGDDIVDDQNLIMGRFVNNNGEMIAPQFLIGSLGATDSYDATNPAVAYGIATDDFLVVFQSDTDMVPYADNEQEVWSVVVSGDGNTVSPAGLVSDISPTSTTAYESIQPAVIYNSTTGHYFVVWSGSSDAGAAGEQEIWGRTVPTDGTPPGGSIQISSTGTAGNALYDAIRPKVAYDELENRYLVADH